MTYGNYHNLKKKNKIEKDIDSDFFFVCVCVQEWDDDTSSQYDWSFSGSSPNRDTKKDYESCEIHTCLTNINYFVEF